MDVCVCLFIIPSEVVYIIVYATHQAVILTTLWTPKNIFCFNNKIYMCTIITLSKTICTNNITGTTTNLQIVLKTPKNCYLNQATQMYGVVRKSYSLKFFLHKAPCFSSRNVF